MSEAAVEMMTCPSCHIQQRHDALLANVDIVFQSAIPLLVIAYGCPLCNHTWTDAHEPVRPTSTTEQA